MTKIMCVKDHTLRGPFGASVGWIESSPEADELFMAADFAFCWRSPALESNEFWRQVVAYVLVWREDGHLHLCRRTAGETRLAGQRSIGFGGHVEEGDNKHRFLTSPKPADWKARTIERAAEREIREETGLPEAVGFRQIGYICSDGSPVDRVHLGVVFAATVDKDDVVRCRDGVESLGWARPDNCAPELFESWSRIVLRDHFGSCLGRLPDWCLSHEDSPLIDGR